MKAKKFQALMLALAMVFGMFAVMPFAASAQEEGAETPPPAEGEATPPPAESITVATAQELEAAVEIIQLKGGTIILADDITWTKKEFDEENGWWVSAIWLEETSAVIDLAGFNLDIICEDAVVLGVFDGNTLTVKGPGKLNATGGWCGIGVNIWNWEEGLSSTLAVTDGAEINVTAVAGNAISAGYGATVTVNNATVKNTSDGWCRAIQAQGTAVVTVTGDVTLTGYGDGIGAGDGSAVTVGGSVSVTSAGEAEALSAWGGSTISVGGSVAVASLGGTAVATYDKSSISVKGNVTATWSGNTSWICGVQANDGNIAIGGSVTVNNGGRAVEAADWSDNPTGGTVTIGGDVKASGQRSYIPESWFPDEENDDWWYPKQGFWTWDDEKGEEVWVDWKADMEPWIDSASGILVRKGTVTVNGSILVTAAGGEGIAIDAASGSKVFVTGDISADKYDIRFYWDDDYAFSAKTPLVADAEYNGFIWNIWNNEAAFADGDYWDDAPSYVYKQVLTPVEGFVMRLYRNVLERTPDSVGFNAWVDRLTTKEWGGGQTAENFFFGAPYYEFLGRGLSNEQFLYIMYTTFMDREPDDYGWDAWLGRMADGMTWEKVFEGFVASDEWGDICDAAGIDR